MSYISSPGTSLTSSELATVVSLTNLLVTPGGEAVVKVTGTTFGNASSGGGTWYQSEAVTLGGDSKTFTLAHAPTSVIYLLGGHQPQIYGVDFTGTINGSNATFVYATAVDPSIATDQYATYLLANMMNLSNKIK